MGFAKGSTHPTNQAQCRTQFSALRVSRAARFLSAHRMRHYCNNRRAIFRKPHRWAACGGASRYNRIDESEQEFSMSRFAIGEQVENISNGRESGTVVAVFPTVDGSFRYAVDTEGYGTLQF